MSIWILGRPLLAATIVIAAPGGAQASALTCNVADGCTYYTGSAAPAPPGSVEGAPTTARTLFGNALMSSTVDGLNGFTLEQPTTVANLAIGELTVPSGQTAGIFRTNDCDAVSCNGRFNTTGASENTPAIGTWWETAGDFVIRFNSAVSAFGFYATDFGDYDGSLSIVLTDTNNDTLTRLVTPGQQISGSLDFFGVIDQKRKFISATFDLTQANPTSPDRIGFDDFVTGQVSPTIPVPLPGTAALAFLGLGLLGTTRRRRG